MATVDVPTADSSAGVDGSPRRRRLRRSTWLILVAVVVGVAALVVGLEALALMRDAKQAQASLESFKARLTATDDVGARRELVDARNQLAAARAKYNSFPLALTRHIPILSWPISDAGHLLSAADEVQSAGTDALGLYEQVRGSKSKLFRNETVSIHELTVVSRDAAAMVGKMDTAIRELRAVHAAFWEPLVGKERDRALHQVASVRSQGATAQRLLQLAPGLVGARGPRTYLVVVLNPAELEGAGGAALNLTAMNFNHGALKVIKNGATSDLASQVTPFKPLAIDPWLQQVRGPQFLGAVDRSPDWRTSGVELMRGFTARFHIHVDGVIALDPVALQILMKQIPPFTTPGYGRVSADNIVQTLLEDSYTKFKDAQVRHAYNEALTQQLLHRVLGGGHLLTKASALHTAAVQGHLQIFMNDPKVQKAVASAGLLRTLPDPGRGDVIGVYTTNHNASKVDVWQHRSITQQVTVYPDGSVDAIRTLYLMNGAPRYTGPGKDPGIGYLTRWSGPLVTFYLPANAGVRSLTQDGRQVAAERFLERGLGVLQMSEFLLPPGGATTIVLHYTLPPGTVRGGHYAFAVAAQPTVLPAPLTIQVAGADCTATGSGWSNSQGVALYRSPQTLMFNATVACRT